MKTFSYQYASFPQEKFLFIQITVRRKKFVVIFLLTCRINSLGQSCLLAQKVQKDRFSSCHKVVWREVFE